MPLQTQPKQLQAESMTQFLGVNLRQDRLSMADNDMVKAINADMHAFPGTITTRFGSTAVHAGNDAPIRLIRRLKGNNSSRQNFSVGGTRAFKGTLTEMADGLSSDGAVSIFEYRSLNEITSRIFLSSRSRMLRIDDIGGPYSWGIEPPAVAPPVAIGSGTGLTGDYSVKYTYARKIGAALIHESNPSPASATLTLANQDINVMVTASGDPQVTHIRVYRTTAGGTTYLFDTEVANLSATVTLSQADSGLGAAVDENNTRPPNAGLALVHNDRVWLIDDPNNPNRAYFSQKFLPESFPAGNFIDIGSFNDRLTAMASTRGFLGVFSVDTKYRVVEQVSGVEAVGQDLPFFGASTDGFVAVEGASRRGTRATNAVVSADFGIIFPATDGVFITDIAGQDQPISTEIQPIFFGETVNDIPPINFDNFDKMAATFYKGRYYLAYNSTESMDDRPDQLAVFSFDTRKWYFYSYDLTAFHYSEPDDLFLAGDNSGSIYKIENVAASGDSNSAGTSQSDIEMTINLASRDGGDRFVRKLYEYFRVDATVPTGESLTAEFLLDGVSKRTVTITGTRTRLLQRLPATTRGFTWSVDLSYTGKKRPKIHGVTALWMPLIQA